MATLFIDPGSLSRELLLEKPEVTSDEAGELVENWVEIASIWAQIEPMGSGLRMLGDQDMPEVTHRITLRMRRDIGTAMRLRKGLRKFRIVTMHDPDDSGRYLVCRAREEL
ncbi:phage head closure protein [Phyllobacterium endophyticum]|nr:phage head closure protein [Phyllobacterium endophyticum]MBB3238124.1 SPP1 family predicted phage head-tail adaptor [Phyllobacterium endophyticum]